MANEAILSIGIRTLVTQDAELIITLEEEPVGDLLPDEVVIRVEGSPINPTDLRLLLGPADLTRMAAFSSNGRPGLRAPIHPEQMSSLKSRIGVPLPVGTEGAGTVIRAGSNAADLLGKTVSTMSGGMYASLRRVNAADGMVLPAGTNAQAAASLYANPLTALSMVEVMRRDGHSALIHTAAASNLGQMLNRICIKDGIPLVNVVRSEEQGETLRSIGARHVVNSNAGTFFEDLTAAITTTGATLAFDAVGGGSLPDTILLAMEASLSAQQTTFSRYGTMTPKQLYIYGSLNSEPTILTRSYGSSWAVARYWVMEFLQKADKDTVTALKNRIVQDMSTTFVTQYKDVISLENALTPEFAKEYSRKSTGNKFLINPSL